jgi:hypothetical protein
MQHTSLPWQTRYLWLICPFQPKVKNPVIAPQVMLPSVLPQATSCSDIKCLKQNALRSRELNKVEEGGGLGGLEAGQFRCLKVWILTYSILHTHDPLSYCRMR